MKDEIENTDAALNRLVYNFLHMKGKCDSPQMRAFLNRQEIKKKINDFADSIRQDWKVYLNKAAGEMENREEKPDFLLDDEAKNVNKSEPNPAESTSEKIVDSSQSPDVSEVKPGTTLSLPKQILTPHCSQPVKKTEVLRPESKPDMKWDIRLPNGKVGSPYLFAIKSEGILYDFIGLDELGLWCNKETNLIEGVPNKAGDHRIRVQYRYANAESLDRPFIERETTLIINPDPKSLWKDIPSDRNDPFWKEDVASNVVMAERLLVAASKRGRSHAHEGKCRDDDFSIKFFENTGWHCAVVCDGAGSAKFSRKGSEIATTTMTDEVDLLLEKETSGDIIDSIGRFSSGTAGETEKKKIGIFLYKTVGTAAFKAYKAIQTFAKDNGTVKDFATTMIAAICKRFDSGWFIGAYWVGDGGIGVYNKDKPVITLGKPDSGEFAGQTKFLTMDEVWDSNVFYSKLNFCVVEDFTALVLMTDGVSDPKFDAESNLEKSEKWEALWADLSREVELNRNNDKIKEQLLGWLDFWSPGNHDDRTIALLL